MESLQERRLPDREGGASAGDCDQQLSTRISDSGVDSLEERLSPSESLISQDTLDFIFQGFESSGKRNLPDLTPDSETQSFASDKKTLSGSSSSLRDSSKNLFQRLGALYSDNPLLSSPIHRTEATFGETMSSQATSTHSTARLEKLSALADSISSWEEEMPAHARPEVVRLTPKKCPAPLPPQTVADERDFIRKPSIKKTRAPDIPKLPPRGQENAPIPQIPVKSPVKGGRDPAEMSLKERLALFERNRNNGRPLSKPPVPQKPPSVSAGGIRDKIATLFSSGIENAGPRRQREADVNAARQAEAVLRPLLPPPAPPAVPSPAKRKSGELENIEMVPIVEEPKRPKTIQADNAVAIQVRQLEGGAKQRPQGAPQHARRHDEDSSTKNSLATSEGTSIVANEGEKSAEKNITQSVLKTLLDNARLLGENDSDDSSSDLSGHLEDVEECLDDTFHLTSDDERNEKGSISSESFLYRRTPKKPAICAIREEDLSDDEDDSGSPLLHSVSFYRKQQQNRSQVKCQKKLQVDDATAAIADDSSWQLEVKAKKLNEEIHKQQQIISQTSQALNLCAATVEFSGSSESVEGERHLLVATHRRLAVLNELQRMNVEKSVRPRDSPPEMGSLSVSGITIPLAQAYIRQMATDTIPGHHLVCLLKYNDSVLATQSIITLPGLVAVKFADELHLPEVYADFKVTLEVYGMAAQREVLPHELKYHILGKKLPSSAKKGFMGVGGTPVKRLRKPIVESPAGPSAVRSPAFTLYGSVIFSLREAQRRTMWTLNRTSFAPDPVEGVIHMRVSCQLRNTTQYRGFLTMFEDVSGLGAWHRRWCHLHGTTLNYWKYPDDETKKLAIGSIDLQLCRVSKIAAVPRDICARMNTLLLELERPRMATDEESLVLIPRGKTTVVRHLLSTDTKEEREEWCENLNYVLRLIKSWESPKH
ncbi:anillin-like [Phlebotomus argentipes]|uniref:anillin-like n=1 Tax=Phlebotomus argentipes TaxID=94469 RepID=UPI0028934BE5|nr:anillin-like [Phlebotomus argentipes]